MGIKTSFSELFNLAGPIIVAPMGGGPTTPELVAASSNAGALGSLAGAYLSPDQLRIDILRTRTLTQRPFAVNLFTPAPKPFLPQSKIEEALSTTRVYRKELGLSDPTLVPPFQEDFEKQFSVVLSETPAVFSFVFGLLDKHYLEECHRRGIYTIGAAATLEEGVALETLGVKAVVAQGLEAGGHRAIFSAESDDPLIGTMSLTQALARTLKIPIIASGGIMNGHGITEALHCGAQAVQLGTAFLLCKEAGTSEVYRRALLERRHSPTRITRVFSGRLARGLENRFIREMEMKPSAILSFPAQNVLTRDIRNEATKQSKADYLSLWAGTGVSLIREDSTANLVKKLVDEMKNG